MLRADPRPWLHRMQWRIGRWWRRGSLRQRFRRRLLTFSAPVVALLLAVVAKILTVLLVGGAAVENYARHDIEALRGDIGVLSVANWIEPAKLPFTRGDLAVLESRIDDAERDFAEADRRTGGTQCSVRVNLELVRETQGDLAARDGDRERARAHYLRALEAVRGARAGCFAGNDDTDPDRRYIRAEAEPRLIAKIESLDQPPPPTPSPPPPSPPPPSPPPEGGGQGGGQAGGQGGGGQAGGQGGGGAGGGGEGGGQAGAPPTTAPSPPPQRGGGPERPVFGQDGGAGGGTGRDGMNDVSPDRLPSSGTGTAPGHELGVGTGDPIDRLRDALGNADASGGNRDPG